jgi:mannose-1-phosphate guanylyltransferase
MAGGIGSRFWPMSLSTFPKQFHDILGTGKTLIQQTYDRFLPLIPKENFIVVTNEAYKNLVKEQLPDLTDNQILCEPARRNTAPCIAYATHKIAQKDPNAVCIVAPSDHLIMNQVNFLEIIQTAINTSLESNALVTLGIKPSRPDTGYGYIQFNQEPHNGVEHVRKVKTFTEKPSLEIAQEFLNSGDFYWNSGMFIWSISAISAAFEQYSPEINNLFKEGALVYNTPQETEFIQSIYPTCPNISIDYGIMEKADNVYVVLGDFGWSDLGTWGSLYTHQKHDEHGNAIVGKNVMTYDCHNNIINVPKQKLVVLQGLNDYIVVESNNTLLVCKKQDEQQIKQFVTDITLEKGNKFV